MLRLDHVIKTTSKTKNRSVKPGDSAALCDTILLGAGQRAKGVEPSTFSLEGYGVLQNTPVEPTDSTLTKEADRSTDRSELVLTEPAQMTEAADVDPALAEVIAAWPALSLAMRSAIAAMVRAGQSGANPK